MTEKHSLIKWFFYDAKNLYMYKKWLKRPPQKHEYAYETYRKTINGQKFLPKKEVNKIIAEKILNKEPFWVGRMGLIEMDMVRHVMEYDLLPGHDHRASKLGPLCSNAGFFPNDVEYASKYGHLMLECAKNIDLQGFWDLYMEDYMLSEYQESTKNITTLDALEPWNLFFDRKYGSVHGKGRDFSELSKTEDDVIFDEIMERPWTYALKGKKVLVIHPFAESIKAQYENNRQHIFERIYKADDILPEFELKTIKAVQTIGDNIDDRFETWFDALDYMTEQCKNIDFDVAIIGCGAYGYPLASRIKNMGKVAIHLGGATQLLFGIMGNRWETTHNEIAKEIANEYWIRPAAEERPKSSDKVEDGCYW